MLALMSPSTLRNEIKNFKGSAEEARAEGYDDLAREFEATAVRYQRALDEKRLPKRHFHRGQAGTPCERCGLHDLDPRHSRPGRNNGAVRRLTNREREQVNALRKTHDYPEV